MHANPNLTINNKPQNFLILSPDFPPWDGGIAVLGAKLAKHLHAMGHRVTVVTPGLTEEDAAYDAAQGYTTLRTKHLKARIAKHAWARWVLTRLKYKRLLTRQPAFTHIICTTWFPYALPAQAVFKNVPTTIMAAGNDFLEGKWQRPNWKPKMQRAFCRAHRAISISQATKNALNDCLAKGDMQGEGSVTLEPARHVMITPGIDAGTYTYTPRPPSTNAPVLLTLGRLVARKGQDMVIKALPEVLKHYPNLQYHIAGRGRYESDLRALVEELGLQAHVKFLGFVNDADKPALYAACDVYVMPSRSEASTGDFEGFGITYLEAGACGRAVLGPNEGGPADAIFHGETGLCVDPHSPEAVAAGILQLLNNPAQAEAMGRAARTHCETTFAWGNITQQVLDAL